MEKIVSKLTWFLTVLVMSVSLIFFLVRLAPGDPVVKILGDNAEIEEIQKIREGLGLHLPLSKQFLVYLKGVAQANLGQSLFKKKTVLELINEHIGPSIILAFCSVTLSSLFGVFFGVFSALNRLKIQDKLIRTISLIGLAFPIFSLAPILVYIFSIKLRLLPVSEWGGVDHAILPILTLTLPLGAIISRVTRNRFLEEQMYAWVLVLKAKGMSSLQVNLRVIKAILPTILNVVAIQLSVVLAGTIITETIFDIPGIGLLLFEAIQNRDYPLVQGLVLYSTIIYLVVYFAIDWINEKLDPRIQ